MSGNRSLLVELITVYNHCSMTGRTTDECGALKNRGTKYNARWNLFRPVQAARVSIVKR